MRTALARPANGMVLTLHLESHVTYTPASTLPAAYRTVCRRCQSRTRHMGNSPERSFDLQGTWPQSEVNGTSRAFSADDTVKIVSVMVNGERPTVHYEAVQ